MNKSDRNIFYGVHGSKGEAQVAAALTTADRYGMTESEYQVYLDDCKESAVINEDIFYFLTNDPDASAYLF